MKLAKTLDNYKVHQLYKYLEKIYPNAKRINVQYDRYEKSINVKVKIEN